MSFKIAPRQTISAAVLPKVRTPLVLHIRSFEIAIKYRYNVFSISRGNLSPMTSRQRYSSFNCRARGQTEYNLERNTSRSSSKAVHSNNVCWIVSDSRDSQQGHCALRTSCIRQLELRRSWQPNRNFVFSLRPSRRDAGHVLSKYSGKPKRSFSTQLLIL